MGNCTGAKSDKPFQTTNKQAKENISPHPLPNQPKKITMEELF